MNTQKLRNWILIGDLAWVAISVGLTYALCYGLRWNDHVTQVLFSFVPTLIGVLVLWTITFSVMKLDGFWRGWNLAAIISQLFLSVCFLVVFLLACSYINLNFISGLPLAFFGFLLLAGLVGVRCIAHARLGSMYLRGAAKRVVIVGSGPVAREIEIKIESHPEMLCRVVGFLCSADTSVEGGPGNSRGAAVIQTLGVIDLFRQHQVEEVIIALSEFPEVMTLTARCRQEGIGVSVVPQPYELYLSRPQLIDIGGLPLLRLHEANGDFSNALWKRAMDVVGSVILGIFAAPAIAFAVLLLLRKKEGPFVRELRCGHFGKHFYMYRLNSDRDCKSLSANEMFLQKLSITELPQLWNVLRGDMSLVGPRPESPERAKHYSDWQRQRLNVKPGITGLAQVHGLRQQHSSEEKARFDLQYMLHPSAFMDVALLLQTIWTLFVRLFGSGTRDFTDTNSLQGTLTSAHSAQSSAD